MGATPTLPNGITSTLNNVAAELSEYSVLDSILSSGDMSIGKTGITSHSSGIVLLLENYPSFESVAHALMNSGAYLQSLQKGQKADASSYQTGEWVLSGVEFTSGSGGYNSGAFENILSSGDFENIVLSGAGVPSVDPTYDTSMRVNPSGEHGENSQEKALIAPLGFNMMSIPQDWLIPILASSNSSLYFRSTNDTSPYNNYMNNLPMYNNYPSYNPGGFDCRKLIGQSSSPSYRMIGRYSDSASNTMTSTTKGVSFSDPDQAYKACLINQLVNVLARTSTGSQPIWKLENISTTNSSTNLGTPYNSIPPYMYYRAETTGATQYFTVGQGDNRNKCAYTTDSSDSGNWPGNGGYIKCDDHDGSEFGSEDSGDQEAWHYEGRSGSEEKYVQSAVAEILNGFNGLSKQTQSFPLNKPITWTKATGVSVQFSLPTPKPSPGQDGWKLAITEQTSDPGYASSMAVCDDFWNNDKNNDYSACIRANKYYQALENIQPRGIYGYTMD